jgi:CHAT domain-containing protein
LHLRALSFSAAAQWSLRSSPTRSWAQNTQGLSYYWEGVFPPVRAYSFYEDLTFPSERSGDVQLTYVLRKEAATLDALMRDESHHSMAHLLLGKAAAEAGKTSEAEVQFQKMDSARIPDSTTSGPDVYWIFSRIELAKLDLEKGAFGHGLALLLPVRPSVDTLENSRVQLDFYLTLGLLYAKQGSIRDAEDALSLVVAKGESGRRSLSSELGRAAWEKRIEAAYRGLLRLKWDQGRPDEAFSIWESYRNAGLRSPYGQATTEQSGAILRSPGDAGTLWDAAGDFDSLADDSFLSYAVFGDGIAIWVHDNRGSASKFVKVPAGELEATARRFREQCADADSDISALRHNGDLLFGWLIKPVEEVLSPKRALIIETDGVLSQLPLQALVDSQGEYLGRRFAIVSSSGFGYYRRLRRGDRFSSQTSALIVAPPSASGDPDQGLLPIPDAAQEAALVAASFKNSKVLRNDEATFKMVREHFANSTIFHFVGHALVNAGGTGLVLSGGTAQPRDWVDATRLQLLDLTALQLVVLSACSTGGPDDAGNSDINRLVNVFLAAGVPHAVATRWNVDSAATRRFIQHFYAALLQNEKVSQALRTACVQMTKDLSTSHPYYWAGFAAFGRS